LQIRNPRIQGQQAYYYSPHNPISLQIKNQRVISEHIKEKRESNVPHSAEERGMLIKIPQINKNLVIRTNA
jgi:hypothetical protein